MWNLRLVAGRVVRNVVRWQLSDIGERAAADHDSMCRGTDIPCCGVEIFDSPPDLPLRDSRVVPAWPPGERVPGPPRPLRRTIPESETLNLSQVRRPAPLKVGQAHSGRAPLWSAGVLRARENLLVTGGTQ
jgi:hypothetical protein